MGPEWRNLEVGRFGRQFEIVGFLHRRLIRVFPGGLKKLNDDRIPERKGRVIDRPWWRIRRCPEEQQG